MQTPSTSPAALLTYKDYCQIPEDGNRYEVIDGLLYMAPAPFARHQRVSRRLSFRLIEHTRRYGLGEVFYAPFDVVFSESDIVQPDILFVSSGRASIITDKNIQGAPDLIIEILSESTRRHDEIIKHKLYEQFGVEEYWIVNPELETVKIYRSTDGAFGKPTLLSRENEDALESLLLPGFQCQLEDVFSD